MFAARNMMLAGSAFNPLSLSPALWLDASDAATLYDATTGGSLVVADGTVARWEDKSGNTRHATQGTAGARPTRKAAIQNGRDVLRFDGGDWLSSGAVSTWKFLHDGTASSVFIVVNPGTGADPNAAYVMLSTGGEAGANVGYSLFYDDRASVPRSNTAVNLVSKGVLGQFPITNISGANVITPNAWSIIENDVDADNATAANRSAIRINGGTEIKNNSLTNAPSTANSATELQIGAAAGGTLLPLTGDIAEILIFASALSAANRLLVERFLGNKWGITTP